MKRMNTFLTEVKGEKAHRDAVAMGLKYKGFGYWVDPNTGKVTHKTENDQLVPVEPDVESDMYKDGDGPAGMAGGGGAGAAGMAAMGGGAGGGAGGLGQNILKTPEPGEEQAPKDLDWEAGPDGDNCVNDQDPAQVPSDSYVGKTNYANWTAGADGSNFTNIGEEAAYDDEDTYARQVKKAAHVIRGKNVSKMGSDTKGHADYIGKMKSGNKTMALHDLMRDFDVDPKTQDPKWDSHLNKAKQGFDTYNAEKKEKGQAGIRRIANRMRFGSLDRRVGGKVDGQATRDNVDFLNKMGTGKKTNALHYKMKELGLNPNEKDPKQFVNKSVIAQLNAIKDGDPRVNAQHAKDILQAGEERKAERSEKQEMKDEELVARMNKDAAKLMSDPEFDLDDLGEEIGQGAFGSVYKSPDGNAVIKDGQIGPEELTALMKLRDHPGFPTLINGRFEEPFSPMSSVKNNPRGRESQERDDTWDGKGAYWDPNQVSADDFDNRFVGAQGRYAMTTAKGQTLDDYFANEGEDASDEIFEKVLRLRRDMHMKGIAHNDMHGHNIFVDDDGTPSVIDLGLAQDNPIAALMEGMGFVTGHDGQFNMGAAPGGFLDEVRGHVSPDLLNQFQEARQTIEDELYEYELDDEMDDYDEEEVEDIFRGGIRKSSDELEKIQRYFPRLKEDPEYATQLIKRLYAGIGEEPAGDRMSRAFDRLKDTQDEVSGGRRLRKGEPLVPRKNLDLDD